jgi:galactokinase
MPAAIGFYCWVAASPRKDRRLVVFSEEFRDQADVGLSSDALRPSHTWSDYSVVVAAQLEKAGFALTGGEFSDLRRGSDRRWAQFFGID